jgi:hypothetical protein
MTHLQKYSRDSVRRFVKFLLSLEEPAFLFHQTLTFSPPVFDAVAAKVRLNKLLKNRFIKGAIYVEERQKKDGVHYHVLFFFYMGSELPFSPSKMLAETRARVFETWNRYNGGGLSQKANEIKQRKLNFRTVEYLTKEVMFREEAAKTNWWGKHKAKLLISKSTLPTKQEIAQVMSI